MGYTNGPCGSSCGADGDRPCRGGSRNSLTAINSDRARCASHRDVSCLSSSESNSGGLRGVQISDPRNISTAQVQSKRGMR
jgi:hypothetical protein